MKRLHAVLVASAALSLAACGSSSTDTPAGTPFPRPAGYVAVGFTANDTANRVFANNELGWKGAMAFAETNRVISEDSSWGGPFANLYDDGPWDVGGHEPAGAVAGDHIFGTTVFVKPPTAAGTNITISYGMIDNYYQTTFGDGWNWTGSGNGSFVVLANQTTDINATGAVLPAFGTVHFELKLDTTALTPPDGGGSWTLTSVKVKGTATTWSPVDVTSTATAGVYTFDLATQVGAGKPFFHSGLLKSGGKPEWIWMLNGVEYKAAGQAAVGGVTAFTRTTATGTWVPATVAINAGNKNTYITVP
jgi:hypothetical protein